MAFWSRLFRKEKKSDLELYMEQRKREIDTYEDEIEEVLKQQENASSITSGSWRDEPLLQGDLSEIPEQYYFWKDDHTYLFLDYFHEGIFYSGDLPDEEEIGLLYLFFQDPERTVELWYQKIIEQKKEAGKGYSSKAVIMWEIDNVLQTVCEFGLQGCDRYIMAIAKKRDILDYWFCTEEIYYSSMLKFVEKLFFLREENLGTELLIKLLEKKNFNQTELREDFLHMYCKMRRIIPERVEQMRENLQQKLVQAGYQDLVQQLRQKDQEILTNPYINVYEMAEAFFENPEETLESWLDILRDHEEEMKDELEHLSLNDQNSIGKQLTEYVLEAIGTIGRYRFAGVPKCLGENEEWCHYLIYSGCGENLNEYLITMFNSNYVEMVERILELLKPIGSKEKDNWNYFCTMLGVYSCQMFEKWDMPEKEDEFTEFADDFTDRWLVNSSEDE